MKNIFCFLTLLLSLGANAQITERTLPAEWKHLIDGGRFKDRFLPMPDGKSGENVWGTDSVRLRYGILTKTSPVLIVCPSSTAK